jgi:ATP-dependent Clp protease protease subunit
MPFGIDIKNKTDDTAEVLVYGYITDEKWYEEDITPLEFKKEMDKLKNKKKIDLRVNSGGGGVFAGNTIYNILKSHSAKITAYVDGVAASIASVIIMAADKIIIPKNGMIMIHNPWSIAIGDANNFRKEAEMLDKVKTAIISTYMSRSKASEADVVAMMNEETWMTGEEAVTFGFADELAPESKVKACVKGEKAYVNGVELDKKHYKHLPENYFKPEQEVPKEPEKIDYKIIENEISLMETNINLQEAI